MSKMLIDKPRYQYNYRWKRWVLTSQSYRYSCVLFPTSDQSVFVGMKP